ncbi:MAG TPA: hypothetical protein VHH15_16370 [Actinophytocola sp.]|nr:hypothetical protein [Actinophytocola sp.]
MSRAQVQVSIFLSVCSGLLADVRVSLAVRQVYLARRAAGTYPGKRTVTET